MANALGSDLVHRVKQDGFAVVPTCLDEEVIQSLAAYLGEGSYARRNLLALPIVREVAASAAVRNLAGAVLGMCFAVKGTFFNKTQESNWKVAWHQDLTIMVRKRKELAGFGRWTVKEGIVHVAPSADVLSRILAISELVPLEPVLIENLSVKTEEKKRSGRNACPAHWLDSHNTVPYSFRVS